MAQTLRAAGKGPGIVSLRWLLPLTIVVAAGLSAYLGVRILSSVEPKRVIGFVSEPGCDLGRTDCSVEFPHHGTLSLDLGPRPLIANAPLAARLTVQEGPQPDSVVLELTGVDMDMGTWNFPLERSGDAVFTGSLTLPACIRRQMRWRIEIQVAVGRNLYATALQMTVGRQ
jgi:hypothetical protein